jgi:F0F1-type ATP synthase membrane subunit b/b'
MASFHTLCETFLKRSRQRAATVLAALIAAAAVADVELRAQADHAAPTAASAQQPAPAPERTPAASATAPAAPEPGQPGAPSPAQTPVETPHAPPAAAQAGSDHAAPATPGAGEHAGASAHGPPAQDDHAAPAGAGHGTGSGHGGGEAHDEGIMPVIYRLLNFAILAGGLYYFLHKPIGEYFATRGQQIRGGLVTARETSERATAQLADLDRRLQALPGEIEAVRAKGVKEIAAEEARIQAHAEAERKRLIDDVQRDIDVRLRVARKQLAEDAADLAVQLAADRVRSTITEADQARLVDRYATQVKDIHG